MTPKETVEVKPLKKTACKRKRTKSTKSPQKEAQGQSRSDETEQDAEIDNWVVLDKKVVQEIDLSYVDEFEENDG